MSARAHAPAPQTDTTVARPSLLIQRKCDACATADHDAEHDTALVQKRGAGQGGGGGLSLVDAALSSPGTPLDSGTRSSMESRFGHDFSQVRVRDDALAHESARSVDALAYTVGNDVVFGAGQYRPHTHDGGHLLAHELAHTVQQGGLQRRAAGNALGTDPLPALEQEADRAADAAMSPHPVSIPSLTKLSTPVLARAPRSWVASTLSPNPAFVRNQEDLAAAPAGAPPVPGAGKIRAYLIDNLTLPPGKGDVESLWSSRRAAGALEATLQVKGDMMPILKEKRPARSTLENIWLDRIGWDRATLQANWSKPEIGGDSTKLFLMKGAANVCEIDHMVELQFGGNNTKENMQLLDKQDNYESGSGMWVDLSAKARQIAALDPSLENIILSFAAVTQPAKNCGPCCAAEKKILGLAKTTVPATNGAPNKDTYPISAGGSKTDLFVEKVPAGTKTKVVDVLADSQISENRSASTLITGFKLQELHRTGAKHEILANFDPEKNRLPITIDAAAKATPYMMTVHNGAVTLPAKPPAIAFTYPYLSPGKFTELHQTPEGLTGSGTITPTIPLFGPLGVRFAPGVLEVTKGLGLAGKKSPLPGFKITKDELALQLAPEFKPSGRIDFQAGPDAKPYGTGFVEAGVQGGAFSAKGQLKANVPGLDEATGEVTYTKDGGWAGQITLKTSKIPGTQNVSAVVKIGPKGLEATGGLTIVLPGEGNSVDMVIEYRKEKLVLSGGAQLTIPVKGVKPVQVHFTHDGEHLKGSGRTGIEFQGLQGTLDVAYNDGKISGSSEIKIDKKPASGSLKVKLSDKNKVSGEGTVTYAITKDLVATAGIVLREDESVTLKGALEITKPIQIFAGTKGQKDLLKIPTITIPIPGASIGPVGLVVQIDGGLEIHYQVGPGELRNVKAEATFNPLDSKPDLDVILGAQLYVGANAGIGGYIRGAIAVDAKIASLSGGLTVGAQADLAGHAQADMKLHYTKSRIEFDAKGLIAAGLSLGLSLDADITAKAGIGPFSAEWKKIWKLAAYKLDTGLQFGLEAPLHYASDQPFKAPSVDDIKWTLPTLDAKTLLNKAMASSGSSEKK